MNRDAQGQGPVQCHVPPPRAKGVKALGGHAQSDATGLTKRVSPRADYSNWKSTMPTVAKRLLLFRVSVPVVSLNRPYFGVEGHCRSYLERHSQTAPFGAQIGGLGEASGTGRQEAPAMESSGQSACPRRDRHLSSASPYPIKVPADKAPQRNPSGVQERRKKQPKPPSTLALPLLCMETLQGGRIAQWAKNGGKSL